MTKKISILGAGLVGSLLSILLQKRGYKVTIFERRSDMRKLAGSAGRSINLAMSMRGWAGLEMAGLRDEIEKIAIPMYGRQIHNLDGSNVFQLYGKNNEAIYSVSRGELNAQLMNLAEKEGVRIAFNQIVLNVDIDENILKIEDAVTSEIHETNDHEIIIAADGAFSALRKSFVKKDRFDYNQFYIEHGYKELSIPAGENQSFQIEKEVLHIWPRKNFMLIALPNIDGSFTCTLFFPFEGNPSFDSLKNKEEVSTFFNNNFPDAVKLMPNLIDEYFANSTSSLVTVKCFPWIYKDKNMLIGDAAHAIVPFYGQGMNAGFEDARIFIEILDKHIVQHNKIDDWAEIFAEYQKDRKVNGDAVADLALQNFIEMRDLVADPKFILRKKLEKMVGSLFPSIFTSVYEMVSFSHTPYHIAIKSQKAQDRLMNKIMNIEGVENTLMNDEFQPQLSIWMNEYQQEISQITHV